MRTLIIHNPLSGFGSDAIFEFERALVREGDECVLRSVADVSHDAATLADADDFDTVVVSGGDGTVSAVLYALRDSGVPVCVFPSGTANLIAANLGNATEPAALARSCREGRLASCDLGELSWEDERGTHHVQGFALMAGTGFDAQLMQAAAANKRSQGEAAYFTAALANLHPEKHRFAITVDGHLHEREGIACLVANNAMMQGDIEISPGCSMDDGLLDVIVIECEAVTQLLRPIFRGLVDPAGELLGRPCLETFRGALIDVSCDAPVRMEIDGDVQGGMVRRYGARALPACVRLVVDALSRYPTQKPDSDVGR